MGSAAAKVFEKAFTKAGPDVSPAGVLRVVGTIRNQRLLGGLTVPLGYSVKTTPDFRCWFVVQAKNGRWMAPQGERLDCR